MINFLISSNPNNNGGQINNKPICHISKGAVENIFSKGAKEINENINIHSVAIPTQINGLLNQFKRNTEVFSERQANTFPS